MGHRTWLIAAVMLAGCSTGRSSVPHDAPQPRHDGLSFPDRAPVDVGNDTRPPFTTIVCNSDCRDLVVSRLVLPTSATAGSLGVDYDADGKIDNALGTILSALATVSPTSDTQQQLDEAVYSGDALMLIRVQAASFVDAAQAVAQVWRGEDQTCCANPDDLAQCKTEAFADCFSGSHLFKPHATAPSTTVLGGGITGGTFRFGPAPLTLTLKLAGVGTLDLALQSVFLTGKLSANAISDGVIAGVLSKSEIDSKLVPTVAGMLNDTLSDPTASQSTRDTIRNLFDANLDGKVDLAEVQNNSLIKMVLAGDVDVDHDGSPELSLGLGFEAVTAVIQN